eukprot:gene24273-32707_t
MNNDILKSIEIEEQSDATELCNARTICSPMEELIAKQSRALQTCATQLKRWNQMLSEKDFYFTSLYQEKHDDEIKKRSLRRYRNSLFGSDSTGENHSIDTERTIFDLTETISLKEANIQQFISRQADSETNNFLSNLQASVQFESVKKAHSKLNKVIAEKDIEISALREKLQEKVERIDHLSHTIAILQSTSNILLSSRPENDGPAAATQPDVEMKTITLKIDSVCNKLATVTHQFTSMFQDFREDSSPFFLEDQQHLVQQYDLATLQRSVLRLESVVDRKLADMQEMCNEIILLQNHSTQLDRTIADLTETLAVKDMDIMQQGLRDTYNAGSLKRSISSNSPLQPIDSGSIDENKSTIEINVMVAEATRQCRDQLSLVIEDYTAYVAEKSIVSIRASKEITALQHHIAEKDTELNLLGADYRQLLQRLSESEERILRESNSAEAALRIADEQRKELEALLADRESSLSSAVQELKQAVDVSIACDKELKEKEALAGLLTTGKASMEDSLALSNDKLLGALERVDTLTSLLHEKESALSTLNEELDSTMLERNMSDANVDELRRRNAEIEVVLSQQQSAEHQLRSQLSEKDAQINLLASELATSSRFLEDLNITVETLDRECLELNTKVTDLQLENKNFEEKIEELSEAHAAAAQGKDADLAVLDAELARLKTTLSESRESYEFQSKQLDISQKQLKEVNNINSGLQDLLNLATAQVIRIRGEVRASSAENNSTQKEVMTKISAKIELLEENDVLSSNSSDVTYSINEELAALEREWQARKWEHARVTGNLQKASVELQLIESDFNNASVVIERLQRELVKASTQNTTLIEEMKGYKEGNRVLSESLNTTLGKLSLLEESNAAMMMDTATKQDEKVLSMQKLLDDQRVQIDAFLSEISSAEKLLLSSGRRDMNGWGTRDISDTTTTMVVSPIDDRIPSVRSIIEQIQSHVERLERDNSKLYLSLAMKESEIIQLSKELDISRGNNSPKNVSKKLNFDEAVGNDESPRSLTFDLSTTVFEIEDDESPDRIQAAKVPTPKELPSIHNDALDLYLFLLSAPPPEDATQSMMETQVQEEEVINALLLKSLLTTLVDIGRISDKMDAESIVDVMKSSIDSLSLDLNDPTPSESGHVSTPRESERAEAEAFTQDTAEQGTNVMPHADFEFSETFYPEDDRVAELEVAHFEIEDLRSHMSRQSLQIEYLSLQNATLLEEMAILIDESEILNMKANSLDELEVDNLRLSSQRESSAMLAEDFLSRMQCMADRIAYVEHENLIIVQENTGLKEDLQAAVADISSIESFVEAREGELSRSASALAAAERDIVNSLQERERVQEELAIQNRVVFDCHQKIMALEANISSLEASRDCISADISNLFRSITKDNVLVMGWVDRVTPLVMDVRENCTVYKETFNIAVPVSPTSEGENRNEDENSSNNNSSIRLEDLANMHMDSSSSQGQLDLIRTIVSAQTVDTKGLCESVLHILSDAKFCLATCTKDFQKKLKEFEDLNQRNLLLECQMAALKEGAIATTSASELDQSFTTGVRTPSKLQDSHAQRAKEHEAASKRITQLKKSVSDSKKISADMADMRARLGIQNRLANQKIAEVIDLLTSKARESQVLGSFEINLLIHLLQNGKGLMSLLAEEQKDKG